MEETDFHLELQRLNQRLHEMSLRQAQRSPPQQQQQQQPLPKQSTIGTDCRENTNPYAVPPMTQPELPDLGNNGSDLFEAQLKGVKAHINGILGSLQSQQYQQREEVDSANQTSIHQANGNNLEPDLWGIVSHMSTTVTELQQRQDELEHRIKAMASPTVLTPATYSVVSGSEQQDEVQEMDASSRFASQEPLDSEPISMGEEPDQSSEVSCWYFSSYQDAICRLLRNDYHLEIPYQQQNRPLWGNWLDGPSRHPYGLSQSRHIQEQMQRFLHTLELDIVTHMEGEKELSPSTQMAHLRKARDYLVYYSTETEHFWNVLESSHEHFKAGSEQANRLLMRYSGTESLITKQAKDRVKEISRGHSDTELCRAQAHYIECLLKDLDEELQRRDDLLQEKDTVIGGWKYTEKSKRSDLRKEFWKYRRDTSLELEEKDKEIISLKQQLQEKETKSSGGIGLGIVQNDTFKGHAWDCNSYQPSHSQAQDPITPIHPTPSDSWGINTRYRTILSDPFWQPQSSVFPREATQPVGSYLGSMDLPPLPNYEVSSWEKQQCKETRLDHGWGPKPSNLWTSNTQTSTQTPSQDLSWGVTPQRTRNDHKEHMRNDVDQNGWHRTTHPESNFKQIPQVRPNSIYPKYVEADADRKRHTQLPHIRRPYNQKIYDAMCSNVVEKPAARPSTQSYCPIPDTSRPPLPAPTTTVQFDYNYIRPCSPAAAHFKDVNASFDQCDNQTDKPSLAWGFPERRQTEQWRQWGGSQQQFG